MLVYQRVCGQHLRPGRHSRADLLCRHKVEQPRVSWENPATSAFFWDEKWRMTYKLQLNGSLNIEFWLWKFGRVLEEFWTSKGFHISSLFRAQLPIIQIPGRVPQASGRSGRSKRFNPPVINSHIFHDFWEAMKIGSPFLYPLVISYIAIEAMEKKNSSWIYPAIKFGKNFPGRDFSQFTRPGISPSSANYPLGI